jgi:SAM-dependent methyltransferase
LTSDDPRASAATGHRSWPKRFAPLTPEQAAVSDDFMKYWHEVLPKRFSIVDRFGHDYVVKNAPTGFCRTLEVGSGIGEHLRYERLDSVQQREWVSVDLRPNMVEECRRRFPEIKAVVGDCQERLEFPDGHFDRILAIHVLEHLWNLPSAIRELHRLCDKAKGFFSIVIPCEGGAAYSLARRISAQRLFESRYKQPYRWFIEREHVNRPREIFEELRPFFERLSSRYFPFPVPVEFANLCIGATFRPRLTAA